MKIATYNIWNSHEGMPKREEYLIKEIRKVDADVICLQEVRDKKQAEYITEQMGYGYMFFDSYDNEAEGLCVMSHLPFAETFSWMKVNALAVSVNDNGKRIGIVNLHLPWESERKRECQIVNIVEQMSTMKTDYMLLTGDFNCSVNSDVQRYLLGECVLQDKEALPCFYDLAEAYAERVNEQPQNTLDFRKNPRFKTNTIEKNQRFDRIMLKNPYPEIFPVLEKVDVFGKQIYEEIKLAASDHYGVSTEMDFDVS